MLDIIAFGNYAKVIEVDIFAKMQIDVLQRSRITMAFE